VGLYSFRVVPQTPRSEFNTTSPGFVFCPWECATSQWEFLCKNFFSVRSKFSPGTLPRFCSQLDSCQDPGGDFFLSGSWQIQISQPGTLPRFCSQLDSCQDPGGDFFLSGSWQIQISHVMTLNTVWVIFCENILVGASGIMLWMGQCISEWVRDGCISHQSEWSYYRQPIKLPLVKVNHLCGDVNLI